MAFFPTHRTKRKEHMNKEIKKQWVEALRSGRYRQTQNTLRVNDGFCCLGVLCDLVEPGLWEVNGSHFGANISPSALVRDIADLHDDDTIAHLMDMNDSAGKSFAEIADYIEENL